jgi:hypothetical protein
MQDSTDPLDDQKIEEIRYRVANTAEWVDAE